ncbi:MAG TPA: HlyD family efflux transporter periplasmic adaptor subunit [Terriglobales bacterium]|nr:HlyD family efflux transporter periplasmic adaptor subunit [Terriglobales bacterium]
MRTTPRAAALLLAVIVSVVLTSACGRPGAATVATLKVKKGPFEIAIPAFGELQAAKSTPIVVSPESRFSLLTIGWMAPEYSMVKSGDVVIRLASTDLPDQLRSERAELTKIELEIAQKEKQLEKEKSDLTGQITVTAVQRELADVYAARDETIFPRNKIIEDAIDLNYQTIRERHFADERAQLEKRTKAELQLLQSKAQAHRVKIKQFEDQLGNLEIRAPHDGMLIINKQWNGERYRVGMNAWSGMKLAALPDLSVMEAKVFVLESEASGLKESLPVSLSLDYEPGRVFTGKIAGLDTIAKPLSEDSPLKYFEAKVALDATDPRLMKPGIQVKGTVFVERLADVIAVPNQALVYEQDKAFVMVRRGSRVQKRPVETGARSLTLTVVAKGLGPGEVILLGGPEAAAKGGKPS